VEITGVARANNIALLYFPPHSTHKMEPLGVYFMRPFKTYCGHETENWLTYQIGELKGSIQSVLVSLSFLLFTAPSEITPVLHEPKCLSPN
jgi:hypothetical protein